MRSKAAMPSGSQGVARSVIVAKDSAFSQRASRKGSTIGQEGNRRDHEIGVTDRVPGGLAGGGSQAPNLGSPAKRIPIRGAAPEGAILAQGEHVAERRRWL